MHASSHHIIACRVVPLTLPSSLFYTRLRASTLSSRVFHRAPQTPRSTAPAPFPHRLHRSTTPPPPCSSASSTPRARARRRRRRAVRAALRAARSSRRIRAKAQTASIRENNGEREHPSPARGGAGAHHMVHASDVRGGEGGGSAVSSRGTATWSGMDGWVL